MRNVLGFDTRTVWYDIIRKPALREKQSESHEQYVQRVCDVYLLERDKYCHREKYEFTEKEIDEYVWELVNAAEELKWRLETARWPKHHPGNRIGGCPFYSMCVHGETSLTMKKFVMRKAFHPELVGV